jgi:transglutaminase-like putative cysteine protease
MNRRAFLAAAVGTGDVAAMLRSGLFGGKCADIKGLMVALARASGFPTREVHGCRVGASQLHRSAGAVT